MVTFGKVMTFQQPHKDTPDVNKLLLHLSHLGALCPVCCSTSKLNLWLINMSPKAHGGFRTLTYSPESYIRFV